ncbi:BadF/BadG/BcrA/BcrD ATPase family protein [Devosia sp. YIM 151766]|uniref:BadF/BadG/BcrA/BcrD ATPase family protein n=1 Tax=Devosia sp. YIM 151766 TaxID=3017325 RepID=UPI00255C9B49|nr:BadF/BadG/BcrA/BcrD ATPase family protein [Devosia sp. YIM 151766]WIY53443.1 BadF/BadG/BcrA/BcrD ATPase family protein [Devosia sp. YIM 151766]
MPRYYLGVDGGGTNCRVRLANERLETLAEVKNGRSNLQIDGGDPAYKAISDGARDVFEAAGIDYAEAANTFACFGMAGGRMDSARDDFAARRWPFAGVKVYDDIDIAHAGALGGEEGGVVIIGTGSAAMSIVGGRRYQAGGWGFHIGDQMSGAILGRELARYAVEAEDGLVEASPLTKAVIAALGGNNQAAMTWSFATDLDLKLLSRDGTEGCDDALVGRAPGEFGRLMPLWFEYLEQGDPVARKMLDIELGHVDNYVNWFKSHGASVMAIVGGLGQRLFPNLQQLYGTFVALPKYEPLHGAIILARQNFASN